MCTSKGLFGPCKHKHMNGVPVILLSFLILSWECSGEMWCTGSKKTHSFRMSPFYLTPLNNVPDTPLFFLPFLQPYAFSTYLHGLWIYHIVMDYICNCKNCNYTNGLNFYLFLHSDVIFYHLNEDFFTVFGVALER